IPVTIIVIIDPKAEIARAVIVLKNGIVFMFFLKLLIKVIKNLKKQVIIYKKAFNRKNTIKVQRKFFCIFNLSISIIKIRYILSSKLLLIFSKWKNRKELENLEENKFLIREVYNTFPPTVKYSITSHGLSLEKVI